MKLKNKMNDSAEETEEASPSKEQDKTATMIISPLPNEDDDEMRLVGLFGEVEETKVAQLIAGLMHLADNAEVEVPKNPDDPESETEIINEPIDFMLSTPGGNADDMFALYDIMRVVREKCDIVTYGLGKVMSAGVLLLAAGTKGKRKIGKNCRVMIHSVVAGNAGSFHNLENEMEEIRYVQNAYLKALSEETNTSVKQLKKILEKKVNVYLSAEEAVKMGIADIIV
jgi:ATP-dependent Clp endopeptidase proteolytic subunit ClpP